MSEVVPLAYMSSGKPHAIFVVTDEPGFLLGLHHDSKTEIAFKHKHHGDALVSGLSRSTLSNGYNSIPEPWIIAYVSFPVLEPVVWLSLPIYSLRDHLSA